MAKILALLFFVLGMGLYRFYFPDFGIFESAISGGVFSAIGFSVGYMIDYIKNKFKKNSSREVSATIESNVDVEVKRYYGFGGWLIVYFIGITYQLYGNILTAIKSYKFTKTEDYINLITPGSDSYNSFWEITIYFEIAAALVLSLITVAVIYFCIRKSKMFRIFSILFISLMILFNFMDVLALLIIQNSYNETLFEHPYDGLYKSFMYAIVWIPYFIFSKRVRNTYVK